MMHGQKNIKLSTTSVHAFYDPTAVLKFYCIVTVIATVFALHRQATRQPNPLVGVIFCQCKCISQLAHCHKYDKIIPLFTAPCDTSDRNSDTVTLIGIMAQIRFYFFIS
jgi:hypothetical protein